MCLIVSRHFPETLQLPWPCPFGFGVPTLSNLRACFHPSVILMEVLPPYLSQSVYSLCSYLLLKHKQLPTMCAALYPRCYGVMAADISLSVSLETHDRNPVMTPSERMDASWHGGTKRSRTTPLLVCLIRVIIRMLKRIFWRQ